MAWRRRRALSVLCLILCSVCSVLFVLGNLVFVRDGLSSLYLSGQQAPSSSLHAPHGPPPLQRVLLSPSDVQMLELPATALKAETKLGRLLTSVNYQLSESVSGPFDDDPDGTIRLTPNDLRGILASTSDCDVIKEADLTKKTFIASGWTKAVFRASFYGNKAAIKTVDAKGHDVSMCQQHNDMSEAECYDRAAYKLLKEMLLLQTLNHPHIVQVLAYCVPRLSLSDQKNSRVSMVTELGETLGLIKLLQMPWEDRLRVSFGLSKLLTYLAQSPFGAVVLNDFRHQQFVLVDGELKLTDVDDVSFKQPSCETSAHCEQFFSSSNFTLSVTCVNGRCAGFNQRKNIFNAGRYFTSLLLAPGTPQHLEQRVAEVVAAFSHATWEAERLLQHLASIVDDYSSGAYMQRRQPDDHATTYERIEQRDMPGVHDFVCQASLAPNACTLSVFDVREAEDVCDREATCKAFVMTDQKTWTGRTIAHFKKGVFNLSINTKVDLFVKPRLDS